MLDIHSHILPGVDDGSKSLDESVKILEMMKEQGITDVIATPHFYAFRENLDEYIKKIQDSYNQRKLHIDEVLPQSAGQGLLENGKILKAFFLRQGQKGLLKLRPLILIRIHVAATDPGNGAAGRGKEFLNLADLFFIHRFLPGHP